MKPSAPVAGKFAGAAARSIAAALLAATALLARSAPPAGDVATDLLAPQGVISGGFSVPAVRAPGQPPSGQYVKLVYPSSLSATGPDLYVADSGLARLLRVDTITQSVAQLAPLPALPGVRVKSGPDGSVYILRPDLGEVDRLSREGRRLASFSSTFEILQPSDLVIEPTLNQIWIADAAGGVFAFHPSGRMSQPIAGSRDGFATEESGATLLAASPQRVVGIDPRCRCVIEFDRDGIVMARFGEGEIVNPQGIALDGYDRVWIVDRGDQRLKVFDGDVLVFAIPASRLGLTDVTAIAIDHPRAYVADGPGGRIGVFAILPPPARTP
ncbi:hypothetical protein [Aromatoleum sp.]|uniref:hypothetical protein n=1 Tax=Aromatoleum sp. TaxID=2307007 RepID=UPI002FC858B9